jgi:hypothetical protein
LQDLPIKTVKVSSAGTEITEPSKIEIIEPGPQEFLVLYSYPISLREYEEKIRTLEGQGDKELAQAMREHLKRVQQWRRG